jgi:hypothetical protein
MRSTDFIDNSNRRAQSKLFCMKHPTAQPNAGYSQCYTGWIKGEECDIRNGDEEKVSER